MDRTKAFDIIAKELDDGAMKGGTWLQAQVEADGDDDRARIIYARIRLRELQSDTSETSIVEAPVKAAEVSTSGGAVPTKSKPDVVNDSTPRKDLPALRDRPELAHADEPSRAVRIAITAVLSFVLGLFVGTLDGQASGSAYLAYATGSAAAIGVIPCLLAAVFKGWGGLTMAIVAAVGMFAATLFGRTQQAEAELRVVADEVQQVFAAAQSAGAADAPLVTPASMLTSTRSEVAKMGLVLKATADRSVAFRREYELELKAIGWDRVLDGERLRSDEALLESKGMLQKAIDIVQKYKAKTPELIAAGRQDIESSDLDLDTKRSMLVGFDGSRAEAGKQAMDLWLLEEQVLSQVGNAIELLAAKREAWHVQKSQVMFRVQADADLFNSYLAEVRGLMKQQEAIRSASLQKAQEPLRQLTK